MDLTLPIILIGPMASGKSTIAFELAKLTGVPNVPMDRTRWYYYFRDGYRMETADAFETFAEKMLYWKPFEVSAVIQILRDFPKSIIDFGAGHSHYPDDTQFEIVERALRPLPNVFLILPSDDKEESIQICNQRMKDRDGELAKPVEVNRWFIEHPSNYRLSKHVIFNKSESAQKTSERILKLLK